MPREIVIDIDETGNAVISVNGATGKECTDLTAALEKALGTVTNRELKPEYRRVGVVPRKQHA